MADDWSKLTQQLKTVLNQPLPGGRGYQRQRDRLIRELCYSISRLELPDR